MVDMYPRKILRRKRDQDDFHALLKYDVKNVDGTTERYPNMEFAHMVS
jgi:hypothetical protein